MPRTGIPLKRCPSGRARAESRNRAGSCMQAETWWAYQRSKIGPATAQTRLPPTFSEYRGAENWNQPLRKLLDLDITVMHFPAFRLQTDVALRGIGVGTFIDEFATQHHGHISVLARNFITIPVAKRNPILHDRTAAGALD